MPAKSKSLKSGRKTQRKTQRKTTARRSKKSTAHRTTKTSSSSAKIREYNKIFKTIK